MAIFAESPPPPPLQRRNAVSPDWGEPRGSLPMAVPDVVGPEPPIDWAHVYETALGWMLGGLVVLVLFSLYQAAPR